MTLGIDSMADSKRVGLIIPSSNTTLEVDFYRSFKRDVTIHTTRMYLEVVTRANERRMIKEDLPQAVDLLKTACPDLIVFGCTSGGALGGLRHDQKIASEIEKRANVKCITVLSSVIDLLKRMGCRRIGVMTPYITQVNEDIRTSLLEAGFRVSFIRGMEIVKNAEVGRITPQEICRFARAALPPSRTAEVLFFSCTNWRAFEARPRLKRLFGLPIVTSSQAAIEAVKNFITNSRK
jgi:maleate isomerase